MYTDCNCISSIRRSDGTITSDGNEIMLEAVGFFERLLPWGVLPFTVGNLISNRLSDHC